MTAPPPPALGALAPLRQPVFRMLWLVWVGANMAMSMNDVAAGWMMTELTHSAAWVALVSTAATLPMFLFGIPSGALADMLDRRRWLAATQIWASGVATILALVALAGWLTPPMLLALVFLNGVTMAMRWPVFSAIVPSVVPKEQLPAALAMSGVAMNLPRIVGPMIAGAMLGWLGSASVFALNAAITATTFFVLLRWEAPRRKQQALPGERFFGAIRVGVQHVAASPRLRVTLLHIGLIMFQAACLSVLPLVVKSWPGAGAGSYAALLAASGVGAIAMALVFPRVRDRISRNAAIRIGRLTHSVAAISIVFAPNLWLALPGMAVTGASIMLSANTLSVATQLALPDWVRARGIAIYQTVMMGSTALGAMLWGAVAQYTDVQSSVLLASAFGVVCAGLGRRWAVHPPKLDAHEPASIGAPPEVAIPVSQDEVPGMVTIEYQIDPANVAEFETVMRATRLARRRQGVLSWGLFRDMAQPGRFVEYFVDENWTEHLRRLERFTAGDAELRERRLALHVGDQPPRVERYLSSALDH
ncbi:MAG: MFS transporter [Aquabacterium sp.]